MTPLTQKFYCYVLLCKNGNYYTGYTTNLARRYQEHVAGSAKCKYTRSFPPIKIAQCWQLKADKALAMQVERYIKKLAKAAKQQLVLHPGRLLEIFPTISPLPLDSVF